MTKRITKLSALLLAGFMVVSLLPTKNLSVYASDASYGKQGVYGETANATGQCGDNVYWEYDKSTKTLTLRGTGETYNYETIYLNTTDSPFADYDFHYMEHIVIEEGVTRIGNRMFMYAGNLKSITAPDDIEYGHDNFLSCSNFEDENGLVIIGNVLGSYNGHASSVVIPSTVTSISQSAFANNKELTEVTLPANLNYVGYGAFEYCSNLEKVHYTRNDSIDAQIETGVFESTKIKEDIIIGDTLCYHYIDANKYTREHPEEYVIPDGVRKISQRSFGGEGCIKSVTIPASLTTIKNEFGQFLRYGMEKIIVDRDNPKYGNYNDDGILYAKDENGQVVTLLNYPMDKKDKEYVMPSSVTKMEAYTALRVGYNKYLEKFTIGAKVTSLGYRDVDGVFYFANLKEINVDSENPRFASENGVLFNKDKTKLIRFPVLSASTYTISEKVNTIGYGAFRTNNNNYDYEGLKSITFKGKAPTFECYENDTYCGTFEGLRNITIYYYPNCGWTNENMLFYGASLVNWKPAETAYKIAYNLNGGKNNAANPATFTASTATFSLKNPTRNGYSFGGWYSESTFKTKVTSIAKGTKKNITLYAKWTKNKYTITYKLNGGTNGKNPASYAVDTATISLKNPTRKGYTFGGWYTSSTYKTKVTSIVKGSTGNKTLYAKWTATKYKITYNLNGGKNSSNNPDTYTITAAVALKNPTKTGYTFNGWYIDSKFKKKVSSTAIAKGSTGAKTFYAKWTVNTYSVIYNKNGGTGTMATKTGIKYGASYKLVANKFKKTGFTFQGWCTKADGTGTWYANSASVKNLSASKGGKVTLYAMWGQYTVKFNKNNASATGSMSNKIYSLKRTYKLPSNAFKCAGYVFVGWNTKANGTGTTFKNAASVKNLITKNKGVVTLYAQWKAIDYTLEFDLNDDEAVPATMAEGYPTKYNITSEIDFTALTVPERTGYVFAGWFTEAEGGEQVSVIAKGTTGNKKVYAHWTIE